MLCLRGSVVNLSDQALVVCQLLAENNELATGYASYILDEHEMIGLISEKRKRKYKFTPPAQYRDTLNKHLERVLRDHLNAPNVCNLGAVYFYCRYEPKKAFAILAEEVRKARTPDKVPNLIMHAVAETGVADGYEIVVRCMHQRRRAMVRSINCLSVFSDTAKMLSRP